MYSIIILLKDVKKYNLSLVFVLFRFARYGTEIRLEIIVLLIYRYRVPNCLYGILNKKDISTYDKKKIVCQFSSIVKSIYIGK